MAVAPKRSRKEGAYLENPHKSTNQSFQPEFPGEGIGGAEDWKHRFLLAPLRRDARFDSVSRRLVLRFRSPLGDSASLGRVRRVR